MTRDARPRRRYMFPNGDAADGRRRGARPRSAEARGQRAAASCPPAGAPSPATLPVRARARGDEATRRASTSRRRAARRAGDGSRPVVATRRPAARRGEASSTTRTSRSRPCCQPAEAAGAARRCSAGGSASATCPGRATRWPGACAQVGYEVTLLADERPRAAAPLDALRRHRGRRARLQHRPAPARAHRERLLRYVGSGGTLVVQYNTNNRLGAADDVLGPYPFEIGARPRHRRDARR